MNKNTSNLVFYTLIPVAIVVAVVSTFYYVPKYKVYLAEQDGKAILAKAESSKQAQILDAEAKLKAAEYLAQAASKMESSLTPSYLAYLRLQTLEEVGTHNPNVIYFDASPNVVAPTVQK